MKFTLTEKDKNYDLYEGNKGNACLVLTFVDQIKL